MKIWLAIAVIFVALFAAWITFQKYAPDLADTMGECTIDSDCVAATCCHPDSCVPSSEKPDCNSTVCTQDCVNGTMDCGQGSCKCLNNACKAVITNNT